MRYEGRAASYFALISFAAVLLAGCAQAPPERTFTSVESPSLERCEPQTQEGTYVAACASMTSRQPDTPIRDIPSSTQVIPRPLIDDQRALRVDDALRNVSGVQGSR